MLIVQTAALTTVMRIAHLPAALMLGPMVAGIVTMLCMPGAAPPHWPLLVGVNLLLILGIFGIGVAATRMRLFPGTAGIWGMSPGAAGAMVMLSPSCSICVWSARP